MLDVGAVAGGVPAAGLGAAEDSALDVAATAVGVAGTGAGLVSISKIALVPMVSVMSRRTPVNGRDT